MRRDQVKGRMKEAEGRVLRGIGKATGSRKTEAKGVLRQAEGKVQTAVGRGREKMDEIADRARAKRAGSRVVRGGTVRVRTTKTTTTVKTKRR